MKLITGKKEKGLFVKDNFFTKKQFLEVREWAKDHIRSGLGCKFKSKSSADKQTDIGTDGASLLYDMESGKLEGRIIKKVYKLLEPLKLRCLGLGVYFGSIAITEAKKKDFKITDIMFDIHSTHNEELGNPTYNLDWHQDPTISLAFIIYIHDVWEDDWGGDYTWSEQVGIETDPYTGPERFSTDGIIKCKPNRIIIDTININHKLSPINTESERMVIHGWAW